MFFAHRQHLSQALLGELTVEPNMGDRDEKDQRLYSHHYVGHRQGDLPDPLI